MSVRFLPPFAFPRPPIADGIRDHRGIWKKQGRELSAPSTHRPRCNAYDSDTTFVFFLSRELPKGGTEALATVFAICSYWEGLLIRFVIFTIFSFALYPARDHVRVS